MNVLGGTQRMVLDGAHFDQLTKRLSRRRIMQGLGTVLVGGTLAALGQSGNATAAKSGRCKRTPGACETCKKGKCHKKNGKKQCKAGKITPKAEGTVCSGGACQSGRCVAPDGTVLTPDRGDGTGDRGGGTGPRPPASQGVTVTCPRGANDVPALGSDRIAQTFTAPVSGQLTSAEIPITGVIADAGIRVEIRSLDGAGVPTPTVLASDQINNLPATPLREVHTLRATFAPAASVQEGTGYALVLTAVDPRKGFGVFSREEDPCPGQAFFDSFANGTFEPFDVADDFVVSVTIVE